MVLCIGPPGLGKSMIAKTSSSFCRPSRCGSERECQSTQRVRIAKRKAKNVTENIFLAKSSTTNCRIPMPRHVPHRNSSIPTFRSGQYKNVRANHHSLVLVAAPGWNRSQRGIQILLRTKCGDGTWVLPAGAIEPRTAWVISAERLKVICYKCVKGGRNRPALIRDVNGSACTELLKNCLQNTATREINGLTIR
jgi:hypothetical protein